MGAHRDDRAGWLRGGRALARVWLALTTRGLGACPDSHPAESEQLRRLLFPVAAGQGAPLVLLRVGRGADAVPTPRRPLEEVLLG